MPDDNPTAPEQTGEAAPTADTAPKDWQAEADKWKALARKHEGAAKANMSAAERLAALEESQKSEVQKWQDRATTLERTANESTAALARYRVAVAKGLPPELVDRLRGNSEEELAADADQLLELVRPNTVTVTPSFNGGPRLTAPTGVDMNDVVRRMAGH